MNERIFQHIFNIFDILFSQVEYSIFFNILQFVQFLNSSADFLNSWKHYIYFSPIICVNFGLLGASSTYLFLLSVHRKWRPPVFPGDIQQLRKLFEEAAASLR